MVRFTYPPDGEAAEIILGRPPRFVRLPIYLLGLLVLSAVIWAYLSKVDT